MKCEWKSTRPVRLLKEEDVGRSKEPDGEGAGAEWPWDGLWQTAVMAARTGLPPPPTPLHWACHPEDGTPRCVMVVAEGDAV